MLFRTTEVQLDANACMLKGQLLSRRTARAGRRGSFLEQHDAVAHSQAHRRPPFAVADRKIRTAGQFRFQVSTAVINQPHYAIKDIARIQIGAPLCFSIWFIGFVKSRAEHSNNNRSSRLRGANANSELEEVLVSLKKFAPFPSTHAKTSLPNNCRKFRDSSTRFFPPPKGHLVDIVGNAPLHLYKASCH